MRAAIALLAASVVSFPWAIVHADTPTNNDELWLGGTTRALRSSSANALTDKNLGGGSLGYARDLGIAIHPGVAVWLDAGMATGSAAGVMFQTLDTEIASLALTGGLRARYRVHRLIAASARLDLGAERVRVSLADRAGSSASDHGWGTMATAAAALDLFAMAGRPFGVGLRLELGYAVAQAIELTPRRGSTGDRLELPMTEVALGSLDLSGPTFALSVVAQF